MKDYHNGIQLLTSYAILLIYLKWWSRLFTASGWIPEHPLIRRVLRLGARLARGGRRPLVRPRHLLMSRCSSLGRWDTTSISPRSVRQEAERLRLWRRGRDLVTWVSPSSLTRPPRQSDRWRDRRSTHWRPWLRVRLEMELLLRSRYLSLRSLPIPVVGLVGEMERSWWFFISSKANFCLFLSKTISISALRIKKIFTIKTLKLPFLTLTPATLSPSECL